MSVRDHEILDAVPLMIFATDLDGRIVKQNRHAVGTALGRLLQEILGDAADAAQCDRAFISLRDAAVPLVRWEFASADGESEHVMLVQLTRCIADGEHIGYVAALSDVTESHRAREALISTGLALASSIDLARVYSEVGNQLRRAVRCDAYIIAVADDDTLAMSGVQAGGFSEAPEQVAARLRPEWLEALASGTTIVGRPNAGEQREVTAPIISEEGVLGAITVRLSSIEATYELAETQRVLSTIAAQTAAAIDRAFLVRRVEHKRRLEAIGEVAAGVAHELRNPLFGISSAAQLLRLRGRDDPAVERNVGRMLREVERLNNMLSSLLVYGRPQPLRAVTGDPDTIWDDVIEGNRARIDDAELTFTRVRCTPPLQIDFDPAQLGQVCLNILVNALDAAPRGSTITLHTSMHSTGAWRCRLHNAGAAIPPEALPRVFEIFYSLKSGGTGIGLALCQRIVEEHGGTISIESQPENGTAVTVLLPPRTVA